MYFCDMTCESVSPAGASGTTVVSASHAAFSVAVICADACPISAYRALTKSMCDEMPLRYAVSAVAASPFRRAA